MLDVDWRIPLLVIHSLLDEVVPFAPVQELVLAMKEKEIQVEMIIVQALTHFQMEGFVGPLEAAGTGLQEQWSE